MIDLVMLTVAITASFLIGLFIGALTKAPDGRLIIDDGEKGDDYFVAITTKPEELKKKKRIVLKVFSK